MGNGLICPHNPRHIARHHAQAIEPVAEIFHASETCSVILALLSTMLPLGNTPPLATQLVAVLSVPSETCVPTELAELAMEWSHAIFTVRQGQRIRTPEFGKSRRGGHRAFIEPKFRALPVVVA